MGDMRRVYRGRCRVIGHAVIASTHVSTHLLIVNIQILEALTRHQCAAASSFDTRVRVSAAGSIPSVAGSSIQISHE